jgi:hypothetical protein
MGFAITKEGYTSSSNKWYDRMYHERNINEFSIRSIKEYDRNVSQLCVCGDHFEICGTMGYHICQILKYKCDLKEKKIFLKD